ncbi:hypothetical protein GD429_18285 [Burkholderia sp. BE17]|nr:hypothetical protein [Burkholderia sp. BE17]
MHKARSGNGHAATAIALTPTLNEIPDQADRMEMPWLRVLRGGLTRSDSFLRFLSGTSEAIMLPI